MNFLQSTLKNWWKFCKAQRWYSSYLWTVSQIPLDDWSIYSLAPGKIVSWLSQEMYLLQVPASKQTSFSGEIISKNSSRPGNKDLAPSPQLGTTLKGHLSFRASQRGQLSPFCDSTADRLSPLTNATTFFFLHIISC